MKTFLFRSIIGIFFGAFIAVILTNSVVLFSDKDMLDGQLFLKNSLGSIFCGWFFTVTPLFFENANLRLSQQTALHFVTVVILYFILAFGIGWVPFTVKSFLLALGLFIASYSAFWTSFYLYFRKQAKKLNAELQELTRI
jgi:glucan phosphoethanolaminetransferase (alkaline phosphatase superfamily)